MNWYFALNAASIAKDRMYEHCVEAAVLSALQHTSLHPHMLFDGEPCQLTRYVQGLGGKVIFRSSSLSETILASTHHDASWRQIALGAYLRIEVPWLDHDDDYALYTDCDVLFLKEPRLNHLRPKYFAVAPEYNRGDYSVMNSGVMLMNITGMREVQDEFVAFITAAEADFHAFDQGALQQFFAGRYDPLPETLNWKPYWGWNAEAEIVHFHGPKPPHARVLLAHPDAQYPDVIRNLFAKDPGYYRALDSLWHAYVTRAAALRPD